MLSGGVISCLQFFKPINISYEVNIRTSLGPQAVICPGRYIYLKQGCGMSALRCDGLCHMSATLITLRAGAVYPVPPLTGRSMELAITSLMISSPVCSRDVFCSLHYYILYTMNCILYN